MTIGSGEEVQANELFVRGDIDDVENGDAGKDVGEKLSDSDIDEIGGADGDDELGAGQGFTLEADGSGEFNDATIDIVWESLDGDDSDTLATWEGPDA